MILQKDKQPPQTLNLLFIYLQITLLLTSYCEGSDRKYSVFQFDDPEVQQSMYTNI